MLRAALALILCGASRPQVLRSGTYRFVMRLNTANQPYLRTYKTMESAAASQWISSSQRSTIPFCAGIELIEHAEKHWTPLNWCFQGYVASRVATAPQSSPAQIQDQLCAEKKIGLLLFGPLRDTYRSVWWRRCTRRMAIGSEGLIDRPLPYWRRQVMPAGGASEVARYVFYTGCECWTRVNSSSETWLLPLGNLFQFCDWRQCDI